MFLNPLWGSPRWKATLLTKRGGEITTPLVPFTESLSYPINWPMDKLIAVVERFQLPAAVTTGQFIREPRRPSTLVSSVHFES